VYIFDRVCQLFGRWWDSTPSPGPFPRKGRGVSLSLFGERFGEGQVPWMLTERKLKGM